MGGNVVAGNKGVACVGSGLYAHEWWGWDGALGVCEPWQYISLQKVESEGCGVGSVVADCVR